MPSPRGLRPLIIDANIAVYTLTAAILSYAEVQRFLERQIEAGRPWFAPHLWRLEVVSTLHKLRSAGYLHDQLLDEVLEAFWQWPVEIIPADRALIEQALRWAKRIRDRVIYDSVYLALAERLHADFWTADVKLHRRAREAGAAFVFLLKAK